MEKVEIKADKIRAFKRSLPLISVAAIYLVYGIYLESLDTATCNTLFGVEVSFISLVVVAYLLPATFLVISLRLAFRGYKILKYKYDPPLDTPVFKDTIASSGIGAKVNGIVLIAAPMLAIFLIYLGHASYVEVIGGRAYPELAKKIEKRCEQTSSY